MYKYTKIKYPTEMCQDCGFNEATWIVYDEDTDTEREICYDCKGVNE
jgi:hypothetical protein